MGDNNSVLYQQCSEYVRQHELKYNTTNETFDGKIPFSIEYFYDNCTFNIQTGASGAVHVEFEINGTGFGWTTCHSLNAFQHVFHAFTDNVSLMRIQIEH